MPLTVENVPIFFAPELDATTLPAAPRPIVVVTPVHTNFNDFGNYLSAMAYVVPQDGEALPISLRLLFEGESNTGAFLSQHFATRGQLLTAESFDRLFCSILETDTDYRSIVSTLGLSAALGALRGLGDVVALKELDNDDPRVALAGSETFHLGILRNDSAYIALRRGRRFLRESPPEPVEDAALSFIVSAPVLGAVEPFELDLNFLPDEFFRRRMAVLIGRNGVGKTRLLLSLIHGLITTPEEEAEDSATFNVPPRFNRLLVFSSVGSDPYPVRIPPWTGLDYDYASITGSKANEADLDPITSSLIDIRRMDHEVFPSIEGNGTFVNRRRLLEQVLERVGIRSPIYLPLVQDSASSLPGTRFVGDARYIPEKNLTGGEQRRLLTIRALDWSKPPVLVSGFGGARDLSSGELAIFRFAVQAIAKVEVGSLILLDEPETHLHPNFISLLVDLLNAILEATASCAIVTTHSAYIVREAPKSRVRVLSISERSPRVDQPRLQTFGASIDDISQSVFGDSDIRHLHQRLLDRWIASTGYTYADLNTVLELYGRELNPETLSYIAQRLRERSSQS
jgi:hypothetical protein